MVEKEGPEPTNLDAQRAEVAAVLHSQHFTRAPMLAHLLSYLCDKLFAGQAREIKEYSVGVEVFHRGASFDQNADSIVRVEANRLRKRLAAYYASEGAAHQLQITIPLGQYVPEFKSRTPLPLDELPASTAATPTPIPGSTSQPPQVLRIWWLSGALALLLLALVSGLLILRPAKQRPAVESNPSSAASEEAQLGPPVGEEMRILAGSTRGFVDHAGKLWSPDAWFDGGSAVKNSVQNIRRTQTPDFYRTSRQGSFRYAIPLKKGIYELHLHFAETFYDAESSATEEGGNRLMTVRANGKPLLTRFDVMADAGASRTADVKVFTGIAPAPDGLLHLEFSGEEGKQAILSAIEILPGFRGHIRPVRLLARPTPYYSNDSHWWSPDNYYEGGRLASYSAPVSGTDDPELYETERWGNFSYAIPVAPGKYTLLLHFAVRHGDWDQFSPSSGEKREAVAHVFNLFCNGSALLNRFDLPKEARQSDVVVQKFTGLEPNAQGKLLLSFVPVDGYATVTGIEVLPQ
ncbi:MAG: malectin domain-containing carbohydrate-binding protein [Terracidiphilus sp.]